MEMLHNMIAYLGSHHAWALWGTAILTGVFTYLTLQEIALGPSPRE